MALTASPARSARTARAPGAAGAGRRVLGLGRPALGRPTLGRPTLGRLGLLALGLLALSACAPDRPRPLRPADDLRDVNPTRRVQAVAECVRTRDVTQVDRLIDLLDDDDPAVRLMAGQALTDLTGRATGYQAHATPAERRAQVEDWRAWWASPEGRAAAARASAPRSTPR